MRRAPVIFYQNGQKLSTKNGAEPFPEPLPERMRRPLSAGGGCAAAGAKKYGLKGERTGNALDTI